MAIGLSVPRRQIVKDVDIITASAAAGNNDMTATTAKTALDRSFLFYGLTAAFSKATAGSNSLGVWLDAAAGANYDVQINSATTASIGTACYIQMLWSPALLCGPSDNISCCFLNSTCAAWGLRFIVEEV